MVFFKVKFVLFAAVFLLFIGLNSSTQPCGDSVPTNNLRIISYVSQALALLPGTQESNQGLRARAISAYVYCGVNPCERPTYRIEIMVETDAIPEGRPALVIVKPRANQNPEISISYL